MKVQLNIMLQPQKADLH